MTRMLSRRQRRTTVFDFIVIGFALLMFNLVQPGFDHWIAWLCLAAAYAYVAFFALSLIEVVPGIRIRLTIEFGFVVFYFVLFFWPYQKELLGIGAHYYDSFYIRNGYADGANKALLLSIAGLAAFHLGAVAAPVPAPSPAVKAQRSREPVRAYFLFDQALAAIMVIYFTLFIVLGAEPDDLARYQRYGPSLQEAASALVNGLYILTIMLCLIGVARIVSHLHYGRRLRVRHWVIIAATSFWALYVLAAGDRNNFLVIALAAAGGVAAFLREIRWPLILGAIVPALIVYNTVEIYRQAPDKSLAGLAEAYSNANNREDNSSSFALTTLTVRATFDMAPQPEPYALGYYKVVGFGGVVPFVRGFLIGEGQRFTDTSQVIRYHVLGPNAGWSLGSNPISDLYLDFGPIGVVIGLALLGYTAAMLRNFVVREGPSSPRIFLYIVLLAMMSEVPRYTLDFPVRIVVWGYLVFWLYERLNPAARIKTRGPRRAPAANPQRAIRRSANGF